MSFGCFHRSVAASGLDYGAPVAQTVRMGTTAAALSFRHVVDRGPAPGQPDDYLVARVREGDAAAFEEIYDRYARGMLGFCAHMLGSREAAEDALQLTFVSAYRALREGESDIALRPWLYTIARNRCLSELRARRDAVAVAVDDVIDHRPVFDGLADQVQRREDLRELMDDMQRLPADQRAALVLFELGDHPQKEIADVLGVRAEKVKALIFQAREALVRGRQARNHPCGDIREQLATVEGKIPARGMLRAHIDRCAGCRSFEHEVSHQRAAFALILPVALTGELKTWILGSAVHGGGAVAAGVGACGTGGGAAAAGAGACGSGAAVAGGATTAAGGVSGAGAVTAVATGGIATAGTGGATAAVVAGAPAAAAATGLAAVGESVGIGGLGATGVVTKILTAAAIATVAAGSGRAIKQAIRPATPVNARETLLATSGPAPAPAATPGGGTASSTAGTSSEAGGASSTSAAGTSSAAGGAASTSSTGTAIAADGPVASSAGSGTSAASSSPTDGPASPSPAAGSGAGGGTASTPAAAASPDSSGGSNPAPATGTAAPASSPTGGTVAPPPADPSSSGATTTPASSPTPGTATAAPTTTDSSATSPTPAPTSTVSSTTPAPPADPTTTGSSTTPPPPASTSNAGSGQTQQATSSGAAGDTTSSSTSPPAATS
jgi:RNA polymerase sigma factor (sigma-70 family)